LVGLTVKEGVAVERTAGLVVLSGFFQRHTAIDDVDDVDAGEQGIDEIARNHGGCMINPGGCRATGSARRI